MAEPEYAEALAKGWDECLNALAWCIHNGAQDWQDAFAYVRDNNPHRVSVPSTEKGN